MKKIPRQAFLKTAAAEEADADDGTPKWLGYEPEIADSDITATYDTEVLVVGGGTGGLFAACSAGENGAKTLVIDKVTSGGVRDDLGAIDSRYQKAWGTKIDKFEYITEMTKIAAGHLDQRLVKLWAEESAETNIPYQAIESGMLPGLVESGFVFQCDTIAELAEKLGLPADALEATVARYNELYDKGVDGDFGKEAHRMSAVRKAPFYGAKNTGYILCTMDGIQIDLNMNAVDTNNEPIPGLYVVGNDSGGYFSGTYPNLSTGAACGRTVTFGRRAGRIAATQPL